jgi:hypothetical protein
LIWLISTGAIAKDIVQKLLASIKKLDMNKPLRVAGFDSTPTGWF